MTTSCVLVVALLTAAPDEPVPPIDPFEWPTLRAALHSQALEWEILDPREDRLNNLEELTADLRVLRRRYRELKDAPPLRDVARFPNRHLIGEMLRFNRAFRRHLDARQLVDRDRTYALKEVVRETDELHKIWDLVREASCQIYYVPVRRMALKRLRDTIGEVAYLAGDLPPHVPLWHFIDVN